MIIYIQDIALAITGALTITAFWLMHDLHKDSKEFYRKNKP